MPKYLQQHDIREKWQLWRAVKARREIRVYSTDIDPYVPRDGWVAVEGQYVRWDAVVRLQGGLVVEMRDDSKYRSSTNVTARVQRGKPAPAADLAWGWPGLHEQKMHVGSDGHVSELKRQADKTEADKLHQIGTSRSKPPVKEGLLI